MMANGIFQILLYLVLLGLLMKPLGIYMARVYTNEPCVLDRILGPFERLLYRVCGIDREEEMTWQRYAVAMLVFHAAGFILLYLLQRAQAVLPLNPQHFPAVPPDLSFNTAISFITNTNWQNYGGENTMSYLTQMLGMTVQNFLSAASGMAALIALIRGFTRRTAKTIGNFWVDMIRTTLYILLPVSVLLALALVSQGVAQSFTPYKNAVLLQPVSYDKPVLDGQGNPLMDKDGKPVTVPATEKEQTIPLGPVASQIAIKQLGTNGGGFFNTNSAHPFENPTPLSNLLEMLALLAIPVSLCYTFGRMVNDRRQGWTLAAACAVILVPLIFMCYFAELRPNPALAPLNIDQSASASQPGGMMEGKEARFGIVNSAVWASVTTATSCGAVNAMHDSFSPLGGLVPMWLMQLGEVVFGGAGSGLYGLLMFVIISVFIAGLMVGRTPEYLGKKIEAFEMKMASVAILLPCALVLIGTAVAVVLPAGVAGIANPGPHGFSEILYAFSSASNNNGSAFAGLSGNTSFYNTMLGTAMFFGRFWVKIPVLAIAGSLAAKKYVPVSTGTLPTHTPLFVSMLVGVILIVGALTFLPALALGPIVEHLMLFK